MNGRNGALARAGVCALALVAACGPLGGGNKSTANDPRAVGRTLPGGITLSAIEREGDPKSGAAIAVATDGPTADESTRIAAALGGVVAARMKKRGLESALAISGDGYRVSRLASSPADAAAFATAAIASLATPIDASDVDAAKEKLHALALRPLVSAAERPRAMCTADPRLGVGVPDPDLATLEAWRARSHVRAKVALSIVGPSDVANAAESALASAPKLADGAAPATAMIEAPAIAAYDAETIEPGSQTTAIVTIARFFPDPARALETSSRLGRAALRSRLEALDPTTRLARIDATVHPRGACVMLTIATPDPGKDAELVRGAAAIAREELDLAAAMPVGARAFDLAARLVVDPREAAEAGAWIALSRPAEGEARDFVRIALSHPKAGATLSADAVNAAFARPSEPIARAVELRTRVERGQGELWLLLASPCGTMVESNADAGIGAAAIAAITPAQEPSVSFEPIVLPDALGLLVHGPALEGESPDAHARRLADLAARHFLGSAVSDDRARQALRGAFHVAEDDATHALAQLASETAPGHLSWLVPQGAPDALGRAPSQALVTRVGAIRSGPLRVAVLANGNADQARAAQTAIERWLPSRSREARACDPIAPAETAHAGTYASPQRTPGAAEAFFASQIPDAKSIGGARAIASLLGGEGGMLDHALSQGLARASSVRVLGTSRSAALVVRVTTADQALDPAVAQVRALFSRLAHGAITDDDAKRAFDARAKADDLEALDPRKRAIALFRDPIESTPDSPDALRALAATMLKDDALVIVALRPPRVREPVRTGPAVPP